MILLTGPSGGGKTTLACALEKKGWRRLDGDALARGLYKPGSALMQAVKKAFGAQVLMPDGSLNRVHMGEIVFPSLAQRQRLNALVYPRFLKALKVEFKNARIKGEKLVADIAVYFDAGAPRLGLPVVLVMAPAGLREARLRRRGLSFARARAQARALRFGPREQSASDLVLDGSLPKLRLQRQLFDWLR